MNERIREIAVEAKLEHCVSHVRLQEFAEFIIRECIGIAKNWEDELEKANLIEESNAVGIVSYRISRQFGVKE